MRNGCILWASGLQLGPNFSGTRQTSAQRRERKSALLSCPSISQQGNRRFTMSKRSVLFAGFLALTLSLGAQQTSTPPAPGTRGTGNQNTSPPASLPTTQPQTFPNSPPGTVFGRGSEPIILAGKVELDDGSTPSEPIRIERYCSGTTVTEAHTDRKGRFSFQLGGDVLSAALDTSLQATPLPGNAVSSSRGGGRRDAVGFRRLGRGAEKSSGLRHSNSPIWVPLRHRSARSARVWAAT